MNILLLSPAKETIYGSSTMPRLGLAYLSASLERNRIDHEILDLNLYKDWKKVLIAKLKNHFFFGITSTTFEFDVAEEVAKYIKKHAPRSIVILGGPHATLMRKEVLKSCNEIDYCIRGEGEESLIKLIHSIESEHEEEIKNIEGVCYREYGEAKCNNYNAINGLDRIPFPNYDKFELEKYTASPISLPLLSSRGCPFNCIYCSVGIIMGKKFRKRSPENIVDEMEYLSAKYGTSSFQIQDDNFTLDIKRAKELCRRIIDRALDIRWCVPNGIRVDRVNEKLIALMKKSGCREIAIGIESTNNDVLRNLKRGMSIETVKKVISLIQKYKIPIKGFFLVGSPGETKKDVNYYVQFAIQQRLYEARFNMLTPYPGTELWNWIEEKGYWTVENPFKEITKCTHIGNVKAIFETPSFSKEEKEKAYQEMWKKWEKYKISKTLKGQLSLRLERYPYIYYTIAKKLYKLLKRM